MIITISGLPGSGKSTVGKMVAEQLGYHYISLGDFRGQMALEKGLTIDELNQLGEKEEWTDKMADEYQIKIGQTEDNLVVEGRLSFHFIPQSFKIFITAGIEEAARRARHSQQKRPDEKAAADLEETKKNLLNRLASDKRRYLKYYNIDYTGPKHYDLIIDSTHLPAREVARQILDRLSKVDKISSSK